MIDSHHLAMAPWRPPTPHSLGQMVPERSSRDTSEATTRSDVARLHDSEPMEFILSSNWVLRTDGVKDFYEVLYELDENLEIVYDPILHGFRVKCFSHDEVKIVALIKGILDQLVQKEVENGLESNNKIISLEDWRKSICQLSEEVKVSNRYSFPRDAAACDVQGTWDLPDRWFRQGITTNKMVPDSALSIIQQLTGAVVIPSSDGRTVYVGASGTETIATVKRKLETLARFFSLTSRDTTEVVEIFLYNEGDRSVHGEYRYLADGNDKLLRSYILDRFDWSNSRYSEIFQKGVIIRLNPNNEPWEEGRAISNTILPIVKDNKMAEEFGAFTLKNWRYQCKNAPSSGRVEFDAFTTQSGPSCTAHRSNILEPGIASWVSGIPAVGVQAFQSNQYPTQAPCTEHIKARPEQQLYGSLQNGSDHGFTSDEVEGTKENKMNMSKTHLRVTSDSTLTTAVDADVTLESPKPAKHDPFAHLWRECLAVTTEGREPRLAQSNEKDNRSFHLTMKQKAGSRTIPSRIFPEFDPNMMMSINKSLASLMAPLTMWPGFVDFRIDLGRFCFTNARKSHIQEPDDNDDKKHYRLDHIQKELRKRHTVSDRLFFTRVLTSLGADANHIAHISDSNGNQMWKRLGSVDQEFIVEIDATKFTSQVKPFKPDQNCFAVHCTKRVWDFQIVISVSQDLNDICGCFAEDLVRSLQVITTNDRIPELEVSYNKDFGIEVLAVRTRNKACCTSEVNPTQSNTRKEVHRLYISEVWEMDRLSKDESEQHIRLKFAHYKNNEHPGMPPVWYEATLKSDTFSTAFQQNRKLELGEEVGWTPEELLKSGAVEELVKKAANMVKNMDGVGFWNDNCQTKLLRSVAPVKKVAKGQTIDKFW
ncbi:hypothetical protein F5B18DRAFT_281560 [Nemania serpens]|nr:hypothetical protein F5B18DRAFT_281560 [Nemania serpens]